MRHTIAPAMQQHRAVIEWRAIVADMAPTRDRLVGGLRCALAMSIAALWGMTVELPQAYWGVISAALLSQPMATTTTARTLMRVGGTAAGGIIAVSLAAAFLGNPPAYLVSIGIVTFCAGYLWAGTRYPYAVAVLGLTVMLITYGAVLDPTSVQSTAWYRTLEVSTGAVAVAVATAIVPGERALPRLIRLSASKVRRMAHGLEPILEPQRSHAQVALTLDPAAAERYIAMQELLLVAQGEDARVWTHRARWFELIGMIERARITLDDIAYAATGPDAQRILAPLETEVRTAALALHSGCERLAGEIERAQSQGGSWEHEDAVSGTDAAVAAMHARVESLRQASAFVAWPVEEVARLYGLVQSLGAAARDMARAHDLLVEIRNVRAQVRELEGAAVEAAGVFAIFPIERHRIRHGMKQSIASVVGLVLALTVPGGYGASLMMTVQLLSATPNFGAMVQKSILRFTGTLIGGALAIVFIIAIIPNLFSVGGLLLWAAPFLFLSGYLLCCGTRVAYAGLQMALTFGMVVLPTNVPASDLWPATDRLIGVMIGATVVGLVFNFIAPHRAIDDYRQGMAQLCRAIADYIGLAVQYPGREGIPEHKRLDIRTRVYAAAARVTESVGGMEFDRSNARTSLDGHDLAVAPADARVLYRATIGLVVGRQSLPERPPEGIRQAVRAALAAIQQETRAVADGWEQGVQPDARLRTSRKEAIEAVSRAIDAERAEHAVLPMSGTEAEAVVGQVAHLARMGSQLDALGQMVGHLLGQPRAEPEPVPSLQPIGAA